MTQTETESDLTPDEIRQTQIAKYWYGDLMRKSYLYRRQRKAILENCRRIVVIGVSADPNSPRYVAFEKLLGLDLDIIPIFSERESFLGLRCYRTLRDVPGKVDIVQVYPDDTIDFFELARAAVDRGVTTFWIEQGATACREIEDLLISGHVQLVEYENLEHEFLKHQPLATNSQSTFKDKKGVRVRERMSKSLTTVKPEESLKEAISKMEHGHFRHLPVINEEEKLIGMLSDRDIRLIRPSVAFVNKVEATAQVGSIAVYKAAVFDPISVKPETSLRQAAEMMLHWHVGGLPVIDDQQKLAGIITYTDILREFVGRGEL